MQSGKKEETKDLEVQKKQKQDAVAVEERVVEYAPVILLFLLCVICSYVALLARQFKNTLVLYALSSDGISELKQQLDAKLGMIGNIVHDSVPVSNDEVTTYSSYLLLHVSLNRPFLDFRRQTTAPSRLGAPSGSTRTSSLLTTSCFICWTALMPKQVSASRPQLLFLYFS